jgi:hypothetical protein
VALRQENIDKSCLALTFSGTTMLQLIFCYIHHY